MNPEKTLPEIPEQPDEETPQVYSVKKADEGWKFSRREFLIAAATAAATATGVAINAISRPQNAAEPAAENQEPIQLEITFPSMTLVTAGQRFVQVWKFTNKSDNRSYRAKLRLQGVDELQAPPVLDIPELGPGETVDIEIGMTAPTGDGVYRATWNLEAGDSPSPLASGPFTVLTACIAESPHPYPNDYDYTWVVTNPDTAAEYSRVHFSRLEVESGWDYVYLKDESGNVHQEISGYYPSGLWSTAIPGYVVQVQLLSDYSVQGWGFCLDQIQSVHVCYLPLVIKQPTPTNTPTPTRTPTPCRCYGVCTCNPYCTCDTIHYWYPN